MNYFFPGVRALLFRVRHLRLPERPVRVRAGVHGVLLHGAVSGGDLRKEVRWENQNVFPPQDFKLMLFRCT